MGTGSVTITGLNNYFASVTVNFKIVAPAPTATPTPKPTATPTPKPTATPTPKPTATPTPKPTATPTPKPTLSRPTAKLATAWNSVTISWKRVANAQSYIIYRQTGSGRYTRLKTLNSRTFSYKDTRVLVGTKYTYRVRACRKSGFQLHLQRLCQSCIRNTNPFQTSTYFKNNHKKANHFLAESFRCQRLLAVSKDWKWFFQTNKETFFQNYYVHS